jgi:hypothetical protein
MKPRPGPTPPIRHDRIRRIGSGFAFLPNRFLHEGFLASLTQDELSLYVFLVLAGDRNGVSFYGPDRITSILQLEREAYRRARRGLIGRDLIAFDGRRFQVLSLPDKPLLTADHPSLEGEEDRATIKRLIRASLAERDR